MHMQAKGTTDYKSGFTFAFEQLLNVRTNKLFGEGHCKGGCLSEAASRKSSIMPELCNYRSSMLLYILSGSLSNQINKTVSTVIKQC